MEFRKLKAEEIEVKVKQVTKNGVFALIYKTSRVDMDILDETVGAENWQDDYKEIKGNLYCGIGIRENANKPFVWKWDCGIESRSDGDGNEKKGEASDAFKRAGVKWGIGRELYTAPQIFIKQEIEKEVKNGKEIYKLKNPYIKFDVSEIEYEGKTISKLTIIDEKGNKVFEFKKKNTQNKPSNATKTNETGLPFPDNGINEKKPNKDEIKARRQAEILEMQTLYYAEDDGFMKRLTAVINSVGKKISDFSDKDYEQLLVSIKNKEI